MMAPRTVEIAFTILVLTTISVSSAPSGGDQSAPVDNQNNNDRCTNPGHFVPTFLGRVSGAMKQALEEFFEVNREYCDVWDRYYQLEDARKTEFIGRRKVQDLLIRLKDEQKAMGGKKDEATDTKYTDLLSMLEWSMELKDQEMLKVRDSLKDLQLNKRDKVLESVAQAWIEEIQKEELTRSELSIKNEDKMEEAGILATKTTIIDDVIKDIESKYTEMTQLSSLGENVQNTDIRAEVNIADISSKLGNFKHMQQSPYNILSDSFLILGTINTCKNPYETEQWILESIRKIPVIAKKEGVIITEEFRQILKEKIVQFKNDFDSSPICNSGKKKTVYLNMEMRELVQNYTSTNTRLVNELRRGEEKMVLEEWGNSGEEFKKAVVGLLKVVAEMKEREKVLAGVEELTHVENIERWAQRYKPDEFVVKSVAPVSWNGINPLPEVFKDYRRSPEPYPSFPGPYRVQPVQQIPAYPGPAHGWIF